MGALFNLALAAGGLPIVIGGVALTARHLVHRHGDPANAQAYLEWFRAQKAAEHDEAVRAELAKHMPRQTSPRPKEFSR